MEPYMMKFQRLFVLWFLCLGLTGCAAGGWLGNAAGGGEKTVHVEARYTQLDGRSVAVLVAANEYILYQHPDAALVVSRAVSARIADNLPNVSIMTPTKVKAFTDRNLYWLAIPYDELIEILGVERLVIIELSEYRTHEPGNAHVWQGMISASVDVVEAERAAIGRLALHEIINAQFPVNSSIGLLNQDEETIVLATVSLFSRDAAGLFYDHDIEVD